MSRILGTGRSTLESVSVLFQTGEKLLRPPFLIKSDSSVINSSRLIAGPVGDQDDQPEEGVQSASYLHHWGEANDCSGAGLARAQAEAGSPACQRKHSRRRQSSLRAVGGLQIGPLIHETAPSETAARAEGQRSPSWQGLSLEAVLHSEDKGPGARHSKRWRHAKRPCARRGQRWPSPKH